MRPKIISIVLSVLIIFFLKINGYSQNEKEKKLTVDIAMGTSTMMNYLDRLSGVNISLDISVSYKLSKYISPMISYEYVNTRENTNMFDEVFSVSGIQAIILGEQVQIKSKLLYFEYGTGVFIDYSSGETKFSPVKNVQKRYNPGIKFGFGFCTPLSDAAGIILKPSYNNYWRDGCSFSYIDFIGGVFMKF
jgi:hypothetical protein